MMAHNATLNDLARLMKTRHLTGQSPFTLALGSDYAATFNDFIIRASDSNGAVDLKRFYERARNWGPEDRAALIKKFINRASTTLACNAIAKMAQNGYFAKIFSTSFDTTLEDTLLSGGLDFDSMRIHIFGVDREDRIRSALSASDTKIHLFKLYGSLTYPDSIKMLPNEQIKNVDGFREELRNHFTKDIILFGYFNDFDYYGLAQFLAATDQASVWIIDENIERKLSGTTLHHILENRLTSIVDGNPLEILSKLPSILSTEHDEFFPGDSKIMTKKTNSSDAARLNHQLSEARVNLGLVEERMSEYVDPAEIPLQYIKVKRHWERQIAELESKLGIVDRQFDALSADETADIRRKLNILINGQDDIRRGQEILIKDLETEYKQALDTVISKLRSLESNLLEENNESKAILSDIHRVFTNVENQQLNLSDVRIGNLVKNSQEILEAGVDVQTGLELTIPIIPLLLNYKLNLTADTKADLMKLWSRIKKHFENT